MAHTREELEQLLRPPLGEENALDKWRRNGYKRELRLLDEREKEQRAATGAKMQDWKQYFESMRAALVEQINSARDVMVEATGEAIAEVRREIESANKCAIDAVCAEMKKDIADLKNDLADLQHKQKILSEKLLPDIALLKRQIKMLEDAHNKSVQNSLTHLHDRVTNMESERRVGNENAITKLQTRLEDAETKLKGAAQLDRLPAWIQEDH
jgi:hypothetical protein